ncbi:MAG: AAA family ATPase, partial [Duncaniella sp.]|nr:AAA family ATPase [Duncaniella sp.]
MERIIFLTGFPGCGKTTMGEALAARHRVRFVDLDRYIEERAGLTVAEI